MELAYLWVNGYRNFNNIGFNLSDSLEIEFRHQESQLIHKSIEKKHNVFGNGIVNVTAIIGKNSTGKSNLLELISTIIKSRKSTLTFEFLAAFKSDYKDGLNIYTNINSEVKCTIPTKKIQDSDELKNLNLAYFSNIQDDRELNIPGTVINLTPSKSLTRRKSDILNQFKFLLTEDYNGLDLESPKSLIISTITKSSYSRYNRDITNIDNKILEEVSIRFKSILKTSNPIKHFTYSYIYSLYSFVLFEAINETQKRNRELFEVNPDISNLQNLFLRSFEQISMQNTKELIESTKKFIEKVFYEFTQIGSLNKKEAMSLMDFERAIEYLNPQLIKEGKYTQSRSYYLIDLNAKNKKILKDYLTIFNHNRIIELSWGGISSGHKAFLNVFSQFYSVRKKINNKPSIIICIDEGDLYLHPMWQQEFLNRLLHYLRSIVKVDIQIILTSHSPFLVSDLPRRNIIYLDRNEEEMCMVKPYEESNAETFGANLLDLYANSFFLNSGTISKFAFSKIKEVVELLKEPVIEKKNLNKITHIISIVGDDVIKLKLSKMLEDAKISN